MMIETMSCWQLISLAQERTAVLSGPTCQAGYRVGSSEPDASPCL
jgi:hypothetical protein